MLKQRKPHENDTEFKEDMSADLLSMAGILKSNTLAMQDIVHRDQQTLSRILQWDRYQINCTERTFQCNSLTSRVGKITQEK
jgi:hypothetical protein